MRRGHDGTDDGGGHDNRGRNRRCGGDRMVVIVVAVPTVPIDIDVDVAVVVDVDVAIDVTVVRAVVDVGAVAHVVAGIDPISGVNPVVGVDPGGTLRITGVDALRSWRAGWRWPVYRSPGVTLGAHGPGVGFGDQADGQRRGGYQG
ncbi:hypothetical protein D3C87_1459750 [compost metagenome]